MRTSRRGVLVGGGSLLAAALAGCGRSPAAATSSSATGTGPYPADLVPVAVAAALDALLVQAYDRATAAAVGPRQLTAFLVAARAHHAAHAAAWGRQLRTANLPLPGALPTAEQTLTGIASAPDAMTAATRLLALERTAAATALAALDAATTAASAAVAASVIPVEAQHAAVLALLVGQPAAGAAQLTAAGALGPAALG